MYIYVWGWGKKENFHSKKLVDKHTIWKHGSKYQNTQPKAVAFEEGEIGRGEGGTLLFLC